MNQLDQLADIHAEQRWHNCPDGYRWRITPNAEANGHIGELQGGGGGQLARIEHPSRSRVELRLQMILAQHRNQ